jgi:transposase-like protein
MTERVAGNNDNIVQQRVSGRSVRAIARAKGIAQAYVNRARDRFHRRLCW